MANTPVDIGSDLRIGQIGLEALGSSGVAVPATKILQALSIDLQPEGDVDTYIPEGYSVATVGVPGMEWASAKIGGKACYNALPYVFSNALGEVVPTLGNTNDYTWAWDLYGNRPKTGRTWTVKKGVNKRAYQALYFLIQEIALEFSRKEIKFDSAAIAQIIKDDGTVQLDTCSVQTVTITGGPTGGTFTLTFNSQTTTALAYNATASTVQTALEALSSIGTGNVLVTGGPGPATPYVLTFVGDLGQQALSAVTAAGSFTGGASPAIAVAQTTVGAAPTQIATIPLVPKSLDLFVDFSWATLGTTQMDRAFNLKFKMGDRNDPVWAMKSSASSFVSTVAQQNKTDGSLMLGADTQGMSLLPKMRSGTKVYVRLTATGDPITGGGNYGLVLDFCMLINKVHKYAPNGKVLGATYPLELAVDPSTGKFARIAVTTTLASL